MRHFVVQQQWIAAFFMQYLGFGSGLALLSLLFQGRQSIKKLFPG